MEIRKIEKNEPKYPMLKKTVAVAAAALALTAALGGCKPEVQGGLSYNGPDNDELELASGDVPRLQLSGADLDIELISRSDVSYSDVVIMEGTGSGDTQN